MGIDGGESTMTKHSMLIFEWDVDFKDGRRLRDVQKRIRADRAMNGGIPVPIELTPSTAALQEAALGERAVLRAREELSLEDNVELECRRVLQIDVLARTHTHTRAHHTCAHALHRGRQMYDRCLCVCVCCQASSW